jgi:hypothetical protein
MAKEWANKDRYSPSHGVPKPRMPLARGKAVVRSVSAWGDASSRSRGGFLERAVRPARRGGKTGPGQRGAVRPAWIGSQTAPPPPNSGRFGFQGGESSGFSSGSLVVGTVSLQVVSLLDAPPLVLNTGMGVGEEERSTIFLSWFWSSSS